jgi:hypothetical protein
LLATPVVLYSRAKKPDEIGLIADEHTAPVPTDCKMKDKAAKEVVIEG